MKSSLILVMDLLIHLPLSNSLKDKRRVRLSITDRLKSKYNISLVETDQLDVKNELVLTLAYVAISESSAHQMKDKIIDQVLLIVETHHGTLEVDDTLL